MDATLTPVRRRLRYEQHSTGKRVEPTERDVLWFQALQRHGPLPSHYLIEFTRHIRRSETRSLERLRDLYHEGNTPHGGPYLDRPRGQWSALSKFLPAVYENTPLAERALVERGLIRVTTAPQRRLYHHRLMVACITASIELAARQDSSLRFISEEEILARSPNRSLAIPCRVSYTNRRTGKSQQLDAPLIPDAVCGLEYTAKGGKFYRFFMVEADRSHEPVRRADLRETSYLRKMLQYREVIGNGGYRTHFGMKSAMLLLTVTTNIRHMRTIMEMAGEIAGRDCCFCLLFATLPEFGDQLRTPDPCYRLLTEPWQRVGHPPIRIDQVADSE